MPKEVRYILFSREEVLTALLNRQPGPVPTRAGQSGRERPRLEVFATPDGSVAARLVYGDPSGKTGDDEVPPGDMFSALLQLCGHMHIPLPRRAHKSLELMAGQVAMMMTLSTVPTQVAVMRGVVRYSDPDVDLLLGVQMA